MQTLFTKASAGRKVLRLLDDQCGISSKGLTCNSGLESDLGMAAEDIYDVLEAMATDCQVDFTNFDGADFITPDRSLGLRVFGVFVLACIVVLPFSRHLPRDVASWLPVALTILVFVIWFRVGKHLTPPRPELRIRDLINALEARRWIPPIRS